MTAKTHTAPTAIRRLTLAAVCVLAPTALLAQTSDDAPTRVEDDVVVFGRWDNPIGQSVTASQGVVGAAELDTRPRTRTGEILEAVPGMIVTQHSGTGKANQMFLRGFNLDHGTDFATWVDGMPVNMVTHAHGQGYTDLNFLIPELVERLEYRKGGYYAEVSDFSATGAAYLSTYEHLPEGMIKVGVGQDGYQSALAADSFKVGSGELLYGIQAHRYDGPWTDIDENVRRNVLLLRYSDRTANGGWNVALMGYDDTWNSADQIPRRAVDEGIIDRLGSLDTTLGGDTSRYSLSGSWAAKVGPGRAHLNAYVIDYDLDLFSNFTYFLDDPLHGDQFEQKDDRTISGGEFEYTLGHDSGTKHTFGAMLRYDDIAGVGLYHTEARQRLDTIRNDSVTELSLGLYYSAETRWTDKLRTTLGARFDRYNFDVASNLRENSGTANEMLLSPKADLIYAVDHDTELYVSAGRGFHSNDARGTTITVDPTTGAPADKVNPLVPSHEMELGFRSFVERKLNISAALWILDLDSELLFSGDAGDTEPSRASRRYGIELPIYYRPTDRITFDFEVAFTHSRYTQNDPVGDFIPGSIDKVFAAGVTLQNPHGFFGALRLRYFGPRPLIEDASVMSNASTVVNLEGGYKTAHFDLRLDVLNLLDSKDDDITYWYTSRLPGEPAEGVDDYHFHPIEPRDLRAYFTWKF
jgi:hypothetical protein